MIDRRVRPVNLIAYGATDILGAGAMGVIGGWILFFYTTFCGLSAVQAATIFAAARIIDAVASPIIGHISDRFERTRLGQRFGRRRFFLLAAIPLLPCFALMWVSGQTFWYYLLTYVFFDFIYASVIIPYETLASEMTKDYKTKARFAAARLLFGQVSSMLAGILPGRLVEYLGKENPDTFLALGGVFSVLFMVAVFVTWRFTWERPCENAVEEPGGQHALITLYRNLFSTLRIRTFRFHLGMYLGGYVAMDVFNALAAYFVVFALGGTLVMASNLMGVAALGQFFGVLGAMWLCLKIEPAPTYRLAIGICVVGTLSLLALRGLAPESLSLGLLPIAVAVGLGRGALAYIPWNLYNYMADIDEIITGRRRDGILAGVMTFVRKASQAIAVMAVGALLQHGGFVSGAASQAPLTQTYIVTILVGGTTALMALGFLVSLRFPLNAGSHGILVAEVARMRAGVFEPSTPQAKAVIESLTGWRYENLWGASAKPGVPK